MIERGSTVVIYPNVGAVTLMGQLRLLIADSGAVPPLVATLHLYQNDIALSPSLVVGDLTEATFSGYAAINVADLLPVYIDPEGGASANIATVQFQHSGGATANICYGFWLENDAGDLLLAGNFDAPIPMAVATDAIPLDVKVNFGG